ncbi:MAG: peptidylprolyl isomerase [Flavobacteriia bacterium]|nr:MAG: peptidylprolyl isomerase [Flavobacteriia bacterium]
MKQMTSLLLSFITLISVLSCQSQQQDEGIYADIQTDKGTISIKLEFEQAPVTVANFVSLAEGNNKNVAEDYKGKKFYDGQVFHRVVPNFVIQAGDPTAQGSGGPGYKFEDEIKRDSTGKPVLIHDRAGTLSMANAGPNTNGSQFFITHKATPHLDGKHAVFGYVVNGQEVVNSITQGDKIISINITRKGQDAEQFDAPRILAKSLKSYEDKLAKEAKELEEAKKQLPKITADKAKFFSDMKTKAKTYNSGLKVYTLKKGTGEKPKSGVTVLVNYAGYFTDGHMFDTSWKDLAKTFATYNTQKDKQNGYQPFKVPYNKEARLINGFREGLLQMEYGEKALLFIPSYLGYGEAGAGNVIPPNTNLVFEVEILDEKF